MSAQRVVLIDDERLPMLYYVRALEDVGFVVDHVRSTDDAIELLSRDAANVAAIVLDIMMPPGEIYADADTQEGLLTGVLLREEISKVCPGIPVVVLTNVSNPEVLSRIRLEPNLVVVQKLDLPPRELASLIGRLLEDGQ